MAQATTTRKLAIAGRLLTAQARRSRYRQALARGFAAGWRGLAVPLRRLWHQVAGFVFLSIAAIGGSAGFREYRLYRAGTGDPARLAAAIVFTLIFFWFGASSFWRSLTAGRKH